MCWLETIQVHFLFLSTARWRLKARLVLRVGRDLWLIFRKNRRAVFGLAAISELD